MSLDPLHKHEKFLNFIEVLKDINHEEDITKQINQIKKNAKEIIENTEKKQEGGNVKKTLSQILNTYYNNLDTRKHININNNTEDEITKKIVKLGVEEDKHLNELKKQLKEAEPDLSPEEITILVSEPYCKYIDEHPQTGGNSTNPESTNYEINYPINNKIKYSNIKPLVFMWVLTGAGICLAGGPIGAAFLTSFYITLGAKAIQVIAQGPKGDKQREEERRNRVVKLRKEMEKKREKERRERFVLKGGNSDNNYKKYLQSGKACMEENYSNYIDDVILPKLENGTLMGKIVPLDNNKNLPLEYYIKKFNEVKAGGKRRTRKAKKSKKRSAKKSRKNHRKSARKSRR